MTTPLDTLAPVPEPFRSALHSLYNGEPQLGTDGERHRIDHQPILTTCEQGMWLYNHCRDTKPNATLEIGLAYGYSTLFFLAALQQNRTGRRHTAIDPLQTNSWHGIGAAHAERLGMSPQFRWVDAKSVTALVRLAEAGETFQLIFIDGNHRFDDVLVDFTLAADVCPMGGVIVFDDMYMPAIHKAVAFIRSNRTDFEWVPSALGRMAAFRRIGDDQRRWDHYVPFYNTFDFRHALRPFLPRPLRRLARSLALQIYPREHGPW